jgi:hypothetical protein
MSGNCTNTDTFWTRVEDGLPEVKENQSNCAVEVLIRLNALMQNKIIHGFYIIDESPFENEAGFFIDLDGLIQPKRYVTAWAEIPPLED